jgi:homoserine O-acetyltransferase
MDLFDLGRANQVVAAERRTERQELIRSGSQLEMNNASCSLTLPDSPYAEQIDVESTMDESITSLPADSRPPEDLIAGLTSLRDIPTLVMGVASDILFPAWQQREVANALRHAGNRNVSHVELSEEQSMFGHDTFLLDLKNVGGNIKNFLG